MFGNNAKIKQLKSKQKRMPPVGKISADHTFIDRESGQSTNSRKLENLFNVGFDLNGGLINQQAIVEEVFKDRS